MQLYEARRYVFVSTDDVKSESGVQKSQLDLRHSAKKLGQMYLLLYRRRSRSTLYRGPFISSSSGINNYRITANAKISLKLTIRTPGIERIQALADISRSAPCCRSNKTRAPIANRPNMAHLEGTSYHCPNLHLAPSSSVGMRRAYIDRHTDGREQYKSAPQLRLTQNVIMAYSRMVDFLIHFVVIAAKTTEFSDADGDNHSRVQNDVHVLSVNRQFYAATETAFCCD